MKVNKKGNQKRTAEWAERKRNVASKQAFKRKSEKYLSTRNLIAMYA